jgi:hypothetical protein
MRSILIAALLALSASAYAEEELSVTVVDATAGEQLATAGVECASFFTITASFVSALNQDTYPESVVELAEQKLLDKAVLSLGIAKAFTLDSEEDALTQQMNDENERIMALMTDEPEVAEAIMVERAATCDAFLDTF